MGLSASPSVIRCHENNVGTAYRHSTNSCLLTIDILSYMFQFYEMTLGLFDIIPVAGFHFI
jgi:hypothetical protein